MIRGAILGVGVVIVWVSVEAGMMMVHKPVSLELGTVKVQAPVSVEVVIVLLYSRFTRFPTNMCECV